MASPDTRAFLKLSRERLRASSEKRADPPIEIYESPTLASPYLSATRSPGVASLDEHIRIVCADGNELLVPRLVALRSGCIRHMLEEGLGSFRERVKRVIHLPALSGETLERVFQFCSMDALLNRRSRGARRALFRSTEDIDEDESPSGTPLRSSLPTSSPSTPQRRTEQAIAFCFALPHESVLEMLAAAHFLDIPELLSATCRMVADNIDGTFWVEFSPSPESPADVDTLDGLPPDAVMQILEMLPADKLAAVETQGKFAELPDTTELWRVQFHERGLRTDEWLHQCSWSERARALGRALPPDESETRNWKCAVLHHLLQTALDAYSPSSLPALLELAANGASHIRAVALQPHHLDDGLLERLLPALPALQFLDLSGCAVSAHVPLLRELLHSPSDGHPALLALRLAACSLTDAELQHLILPVPPRLQLLDVSNNALGSDSLPALADLLQGPLTHLSISYNSFALDEVTRFFGAALFAPRLRLLDLGDTQCAVPKLTAEAWLRVKSSSVVEQLFLNDTAIADSLEAFTTFCMHLPPRLDHLGLKSVGLRAPHVQAMSLHAASWASLASLDVADNYLNRDTAPFLDTLLVTCPSLTSLDVSVNSLGEVGARALAHALSSPACALRRLNAADTELRAGAVEVAGAAVRATCRLRWLAMDAPPQVSAHLASLFAQRPSLSVLV